MYLYLLTTCFGQIVQPSSGSQQIRIKKANLGRGISFTNNGYVIKLSCYPKMV